MGKYAVAPIIGMVTLYESAEEVPVHYVGGEWSGYLDDEEAHCYYITGVNGYRTYFAVKGGLRPQTTPPLRLTGKPLPAASHEIAREVEQEAREELAAVLNELREAGKHYAADAVRLALTALKRG